MFKVSEYLHLFHEDLYRMVNSNSPRITLEELVAHCERFMKK
ncbi:hypothetical protein [Hahella sp. CCB-MM4]|nr:hypothetical protein [Hahella sp. CCB-MM4]